MSENILSTGKNLLSDIAQAIKNDVQPLDEKSQKRLDELTQASLEKSELNESESSDLTKAKPARFQLKDVVLPFATENEIR
jgi:polyhydroxyalkanoate synthesis regulator phasin